VIPFVLLGLVAALGVGLIYFGFIAPGPLEQAEPAYIEVEDTPSERRPPLERMRQVLSEMARPLAGQRPNQMQVELSRAGLNLRAQEFVLMQVTAAAVLGAVVFLRFFNILPALGAGVVGYFIPVLWLRYMQRKRRQAFEASLGDTVVLLSNGIKAGLSIQQSIAGVAESGRPPLSEEIARVVRETSFGIEMETALEHCNKRLDSKDFDMLVTAVLIHRTVGGNLAEVLDKIAETIRERVRIQGEVRVLTAQTRASGYIITSLPFVVVIILSFLTPSFETPLLTNPIGWALITISLVSIGIGFAIIRRITDIHL
jgi:tight adherence protein B